MPGPKSKLPAVLSLIAALLGLAGIILAVKSAPARTKAELLEALLSLERRRDLPVDEKKRQEQALRMELARHFQ